MRALPGCLYYAHRDPGRLGQEFPEGEAPANVGDYCCCACCGKRADQGWAGPSAKHCRGQCEKRPRGGANGAGAGAGANWRREAGAEPAASAREPPPASSEEVGAAAGRPEEAGGASEERPPPSPAELARRAKEKAEERGQDGRATGVPNRCVLRVELRRRGTTEVLRRSFQVPMRAKLAKLKAKILEVWDLEELRHQLRIEQRAQVLAWGDDATCESLGLTSGALVVAEEKSRAEWAMAAQRKAQCLAEEADRAKLWFQEGHLRPTRQGPRRRSPRCSG